jgi:hypothetical protein
MLGGGLVTTGATAGGVKVEIGIIFPETTGGREVGVITVKFPNQLF